MSRKKLDQTLLDILTTYGERPEDALWDCHGTWVAYHKAIERIAAKAGIVFDMPQIIEANSAGKIVAIAVQGHMGDRAEWSFGEAAPSNNKNAYPYAMAEKRAKDRVVLKLIGLHGLVYSEEESEDFKGDEQVQTKSSAQLKRDDAWEAFKSDLLDVRTLVALEACKAEWRAKVKQDKWPKAWIEAMADEFAAHEKMIMSEMDADELASVPLERTLKASVLNAG